MSDDFYVEDEPAWVVRQHMNRPPDGIIIFRSRVTLRDCWITSSVTKGVVRLGGTDNE
jgi:hypothetical protein